MVGEGSEAAAGGGYDGGDDEKRSQQGGDRLDHCDRSEGEGPPISAPVGILWALHPGG